MTPASSQCTGSAQQDLSTRTICTSLQWQIPQNQSLQTHSTLTQAVLALARSTSTALQASSAQNLYILKKVTAKQHLQKRQLHLQQAVASPSTWNLKRAELVSAQTAHLSTHLWDSLDSTSVTSWTDSLSKRSTSASTSTLEKASRSWQLKQHLTAMAQHLLLKLQI